MRAYTQIDNTIELCISPELETELRKVFAQEMTVGFRGIMQDGRQHYLFKIPEEKAQLLHHLYDVLSGSSGN